VDLSTFRILSLCSGVGGIELGFKLAEPTSRTVCYVEIEAFACEILARRAEEKRLDAAPVWSNLKTFDGRPWRGKVDCITGGYPCQPFSVAGKKLGTNDPRHLWPDIKRLIQEIEPPICFFENVSNHLRVGFEEVSNDLRQLGYQIKAGLFTAAEVGAPHKRERLFILAYNNSDRCFSDESKTTRKNDQEGWQKFVKKSISGGNDFAASKFSEEQNRFAKQESGPALSNETELADCQNIICQWCKQQRSRSRKSEAKAGSDDNELADSESSRTRKHERELWQGSEKHCRELGNTDNERLERHRQCQCSSELPSWPPSPADHEGWNRVPNHLKPALHRMADGMADRVDRIRACGNGVVPLVAAYAWRTLTNGMYLTKNN